MVSDTVSAQLQYRHQRIKYEVVEFSWNVIDSLDPHRLYVAGISINMAWELGCNCIVRSQALTHQVLRLISTCASFLLSSPRRPGVAQASC